MAPRPLLDTAIRTEFGDVLDTPEFRDVAGMDGDLTYVPGFSEMRRERDTLMADVASGKRQRHEVKLKPLPVNLRWTRTHTPKGSPDGRKQLTTGNAGYSVVNKSEVGKHDWLQALPPGATIDPDGAIRKGDCILMVCDGKTAAQNAARKRIATQRMSEAASADAQGLLAVAGRKDGTDAFIRTED